MELPFIMPPMAYQGRPGSRDRRSGGRFRDLERSWAGCFVTASTTMGGSQLMGSRWSTGSRGPCQGLAEHGRQPQSPLWSSAGQEPDACPDSWSGRCRPLGIQRDLPLTDLVPVADFVKNDIFLFGAKKRISGLKLVATDTEWSHGNGPEVLGPTEALVMTMAGRMVAVDDLAGEGKAALATRR